MEISHECSEHLRARFDAMVRAAVDELVECVVEPSASAAEVEKQLAGRMRTLGSKMIADGLSARLGAHRGRQVCRCWSVMEHEGSRSRQVMTVLGRGAYRRAYYRCPSCEETLYAGDREIGIAQTGYTLPAQELVALVSAELPFDSTCRHLVRLTGIDVSAKQCQRISALHGEQVERASAAERTALFEGRLGYLAAGRGARLYVTLDATKTHLTDGWHETKLGAVYDVKPDRHGNDTPGQTSYTASVRESVEQFGQRLYQEACCRGVERVAEVIAVADGAPWIWNLVAEHFPGARQVLDYYHAAQRLYDVARVVYGEHSVEGLAWAETGCGLLLESEVDAVLSRLQALQPEGASGQDAVRLALGYYEANRGRMRYKELTEAGCHIGSGVIEAGCKTVVGARCKRSGMNWSTAGAAHVLALRSILLSQRWDQYWQHAA